MVRQCGECTASLPGQHSLRPQLLTTGRSPPHKLRTGWSASGHARRGQARRRQHRDGRLDRAAHGGRRGRRVQLRLQRGQAREGAHLAQLVLRRAGQRAVGRRNPNPTLARWLTHPQHRARALFARSAGRLLGWRQ
jgi:hypothetical protein